MATQIGEKLSRLARLFHFARQGIVVLGQVERVVEGHVPALDVVIAQNDGQRQVVEFFRGSEVERERQPSLVVVHLKTIELVADVARGQGERPIGIGPIGGRHIDTQCTRAPRLKLVAQKFEVGTDAPFVGQLTPPAQGDGVGRRHERAAIGVARLRSIDHLAMVVVLHRSRKTAQLFESVAILRRGVMRVYLEVSDIGQRDLVVHARTDGRRVEQSRLQVAIMHGQHHATQSRHSGRMGISQGAIDAIVRHLRITTQGDESQHHASY